MNKRHCQSYSHCVHRSQYRALSFSDGRNQITIQFSRDLNDLNLNDLNRNEDSIQTLCDSIQVPCDLILIRFKFYDSIQETRDLNRNLEGMVEIEYSFSLLTTQSDLIFKCLVFRLDALALSVIGTATWLAGWLAVTLRYCIKTAKPIGKLFRPSESPITLVF